MNNVIKNNRGQGLVEYLIIVAIMAVATIGIMRVVGQNTSAQFANIAYALQGKDNKANKEQVRDRDVKKKDLSDFMTGAAGTSE